MTTTFQREPVTKILRTSMVLDMLSIAPSTLYDWMNENSRRYDPTFPKPVSIGHKNGWHRQQLVDWINNQTKKEIKPVIRKKKE